MARLAGTGAALGVVAFVAGTGAALGVAGFVAGAGAGLSGLFVVGWFIFLYSW